MINQLAHHTPLHTGTVNAAALVVASITVALIAAGLVAVSRINKD